MRFAFVFWSAAILVAGIPSASLGDLTKATAMSGERSARVLRFDGSANAPLGNLATWQQAMFELRRDDASIPDRIALTERALAEVGPEVIPIAAIYLRVPLTMFVASAMRTQTHRGGDLIMTLDRSVWSGSVPAYLAIDCDDENGFRVTSLGARFPVRYATRGTKTLTLRAGASATNYVEARFTFRVFALNTPTPDDTIRVAGAQAYAGFVNRGDAYVHLAPGHTRIERPLLVVEGFDLANDQNWDELYALLNRENLLERMRQHGFDVVVLNFADATDYVQRNAFVLVTLIQQLRSQISTSTPFTVVGASTGGVITSYALAWMESRGMPHGVNTFISMDAPHLGADVPLGIQHWFHFFADLASEAGYFVERLDRPAAKQILLYHLSGSVGLSPRADLLRDRLLSEIGALGWPSLPRTVAIANGSGTGLGQGFMDGDPILLYRYRSTLRKIDGNVWAMADSRPGVVFRGNVTVVVPIQSQTVTLIGARPYDNAPGGFRNTMLQMDTTAVPYGDISAAYPHHCFVPTVSALALDTPNLFHAVRSDLGTPAPTPFDTIYVPNGNQEHVMVTPENATWIEQEILRTMRTPVAVADEVRTPGASLERVTPNPFTRATRVSFSLPDAEHVRLSVHDLAGRRIAMLADAVFSAGSHSASWSGENERGERATAGIYFVRLEAFGRTSVARITRLE